MAQALFDGHPIEHYLRESGELPELMPGGIYEFATQLKLNGIPHDIPHYNYPSLVSIWLKLPLKTMQCLLQYFMSHKPTAISQFAERFKYLVISSSLLSSSLSSSTFSRAVTPTTPGHYDQSLPSFAMPMITPTASHMTYVLTYSLACLVPIALAWGSYISGMFLAAAVWILTSIEAVRFDQGRETWSMILETLDSLISANDAWDGIVSECFKMLEYENGISPTHRISPSSPTHPLWLALSSSLHIIQAQCDDVRQLLAALTSPVVLSQLTHMYAPPSPSLISSVPTSSTSSPRRRPVSLAVPSISPRPSFSSISSIPVDAYTRSRTQSQPPPVDKHATWNETRFRLSRRSSKRRSNLSSLIDLDELKSLPAKKTVLASSAPSTPTIAEVRNISEDADAEVEGEPFGVAALDLRRKRRSIRLGDTLQNPVLTSSIGSRYTSLTPPSSSNTLQSLHAVLQGVIGAKRFACAHLLALRFDDVSDNIYGREGRDLDADEAYWEDVRSVISLLVSAFEDASTRLSEVLEQQQLERSRAQLAERASDENISAAASARSSTVLLPPTSFAPIPGHLARFSGHVDVIFTALDDARMCLQQCLVALREDPELVIPNDDDYDLPLQLYERLRRELGVALKECERGKEPLRTIMEHQKRHPAGDERLAGDREASVVELDGETPHDEQLSSGESDKTLFNLEEEHAAKTEVDYPDDDATAHLLSSATTQHLPPPGIEQVFEADSGVTSFTRPRSMLSRDERITLARARRESREEVPSIDVREDHSAEKKIRGWGPGGEVVDELKDVIWKVSEQRRKMNIHASISDIKGLSLAVP